MSKRVLVIVLDSVGCGDAPDAARFGDEGANTIANTAAAVGGLSVPNLQALGLGNIVAAPGVPPADAPRGAYGRLQEISAGKDTLTGHWELMGLEVTEPFGHFPNGFPKELIDAFSRETGRGVLGNKAASGTEIIEELGPKQMETGDWIVYTSADSVFQVAAHEEVIPLEELYAACKIARRLCDPYRIGRVIARPYVGTPGNFTRTYNRHDYGMPPPAPTVLDRLTEAGIPVVGVGKISDIFGGHGVPESIRTSGNADGMEKTLARWRSLDRGLLFVNLIDFDSLYGHRRDPEGYARAIEAFDAFLPRLLPAVGADDLLFLTADHGNDPTFKGTDHTREQVPLLAYGPPRAAGKALGVRRGYMDLGATVAEALGIAPPPLGKSFYQEIA